MSSVEFRFKVVHTLLALWLVLGFTFFWFSENGLRQEENRLRQEENDLRQEENRLRKNEYLMHLLEEWRRVLDVEVRSTLESIQQEDLEAASLAAARLQDEESMSARSHIVAALNLFEQVAIARQEGLVLVDQELVDEVLGPPIRRYYDVLQGFVTAWGESPAPGRRTGWPKLVETITEW